VAAETQSAESAALNSHGRQAVGNADERELRPEHHGYGASTGSDSGRVLLRRFDLDAMQTRSLSLPVLTSSS